MPFFNLGKNEPQDLDPQEELEELESTIEILEAKNSELRDLVVEYRQALYQRDKVLEGLLGGLSNLYGQLDGTDPDRDHSEDRSEGDKSG